LTGIEKAVKIASETGCRVLYDVPMSGYTTFKIGGIAPILIEINGIPALLRLLPAVSENTDIDFFVIGNGSNLLINDGRLSIIFLHMGADFAGISCDGAYVAASAGAKLSDFCKFAAAEGLSGAEPLFGIPGTVGGAVFMNAGAYGTETADILDSVTTVTRAGKIKRYTAAECGFSYRESIFKRNGEIIVSAKFKLQDGYTERINADMAEYAAKRREKQPLEYPSAGSAFKRPEGAYASALIDNCGLKGLSVGGAAISEKHAGFIINKGGATFSDVYDLMKKTSDEVFAQTGMRIEPEPIIVGQV
jgi:UDP-N-acetylmuramate dehydrogenase